MVKGCLTCLHNHIPVSLLFLNKFSSVSLSLYLWRTRTHTRNGTLGMVGRGGDVLILVKNGFLTNFLLYGNPVVTTECFTVW